MRQIGFKKSGRDNDVVIPVWMINEKEIALLASLLKKADLYIPDMWDNDRSRIRHMDNQFNDYLRGRHIRKVALDSGMLDIVVPDPSEKGGE